jgi:hypothetical protein
LDGSRKLLLPISLAAGESARYSGGERVVILAPSLHRRKEIDIDPAFFRIGKGDHSVAFDCVFSAKEKEPAAKLEIRIPGRAEKILASVKTSR